MSYEFTKTSVALATVIAASMLVACSRKVEQASQSPPATDAATSAPAAEVEGVKTFTIGELSAIALLDGGLELPNDNKVIGVGRTPEEVSAVLTAAGLPTDKLTLAIHPLLVKSADRVLLFDTGAGGNMGAGAGKLQQSMAGAGVEPLNVTDIFISHFHGDHTGGLLNADGMLAFPNATIHISAAEWKALKELDPKSAANYGLPRLAQLILAATPKVQTFAPGAEIVPGIVKAVDIKGHTPGHSGYRITSGQESLLYIGDTAHHYVVSVQRPSWTIAFDGDAPTAQTSRAELIKDAVASGQRIYAVHFPFPGIGKFEIQGEETAWVPEG